MTIKTITFHQRSGGKTGQILASPQIEKKLTKVEALYQRYHGIKMGRVKFYDLALTHAREAKAEAGGYLQYTAEAIAGIVLDHMHKELGKAVRRKDVSEPIAIEIGNVKIDNLRDLARGKRGNQKGKSTLKVDANGKRILTPRNPDFKVA